MDEDRYHLLVEALTHGIPHSLNRDERHRLSKSMKRYRLAADGRLEVLSVNANGGALLVVKLSDTFELVIGCSIQATSFKFVALVRIHFTSWIPVGRRHSRLSVVKTPVHTSSRAILVPSPPNGSVSISLPPPLLSSLLIIESLPPSLPFKLRRCRFDRRGRLF